MSLARDASSALRIKVLAAATSYGFALLLARELGTGGFGQVAFFLNAATLLAVLGGQGMPMLLLRDVPALAGLKTEGEVALLARSALRRAVAGAALAGASALALMLALPGHGGFSPAVLVAGLALVPLWSAMEALSHLARACGMISLALFPKEVLWRSLASLAALAWITMAGPLTPVVVLMALLVIALGLVTGMAAALRIRGAWPGAQPARRGKPDPARCRTARHFWAGSLSNIFLAHADVITVALLLGPQAAGYYFAANRLAQLLAFFLTSCNLALAPRFAGLWQGGAHRRAEAEIHRATRRSSWQTALFALPLVALAPQALSLFGDGFASAAPALQLLAGAAVLNAATGPADIALNMAGQERAAMRAGLISVAFSTLALAGGTLAFGLAGTGAAVLLATALRKGLSWWLAHRRLGLRCDILAALAPSSTVPRPCPL